MLCYAVLVSTSFPVGEAITGGLDPAVLTFFRFVLAAAVLGAVLGVRGEFVRPDWSLIVRTGIIGSIMAIFFVAMFEALRWTSALSTGALFTLVPLMSSGFGFLINGQRINSKHLAYLAFGAAGAIWIVFDGSLDKLLSLSLGPGELIFAVGCLAFSFYAPAIKRLHRGESPTAFAFWNLVTGAFLLGIYAFPTLFETDLYAVQSKVWLGIVYLAVFTTALTFFLSTLGSLSLPAFKVMSYTYLTPAVVAIFAAVFYQQLPTFSVVVGILAVLSVTLLLQRTQANE
jgi:drug/metabolite transporter (DMT)-like permease